MTADGGFFLAALDLGSGKTITRQRLSAEDVERLYEREVDTGSQKHLLLFEPFSLFCRRLHLFGGKAVRHATAFIQRLDGHRHATVVLLKGRSSVDRKEVRSVMNTMLEYYSSLKL